MPLAEYVSITVIVYFPNQVTEGRQLHSPPSAAILISVSSKAFS